MLRTRFAQLTRQPAKQPSVRRRLEIEALETRLTPAAHTWTGANSNLWSDNGNWMGGSPTASEQSVTLTFPARAANTMNTNDIPGLTIQSILFSADGYSINGNAITLAGGITADAGVTATDTFNLDTALSAKQTWTVTNASATLAVGGVVGGPATAGLTKAGFGTLALSGNNSYIGMTTVSAGTLLVNGSQPGSNVSISYGVTLSGASTVGTISAFGGAVSPGGTGPGILKSANVDLGGAFPHFQVKLNGTTAGAGYSQLNVNGRVQLESNAVLDGMTGFTSALGDTFAIIVSTGTITGTFDLLPDNANVVLGDQNFRINYYPNSVVLTRAEGVLTSLVPAITSLSQTVVPEGSQALTLSVTGINLMPNSVVRLNAVPLTTTFVSSTQVQAAIPAAVLIDEADFAVSVLNPGLGGGVSNGLTLNVSEALLPDGTRGTLNQRVVSELYVDLLGRPVDPTGLAVHTLLLNQGASVAFIASAITQSSEYRTNVVQALYRRYLHRAADTSALVNIVGDFAFFGRTVEDLATDIVNSQEYFQVRGGGTNDGFLKALYQDALSRDIDSSGQSTFSRALANGISRLQVASVIFSSDEYRIDLVQSFYQRFLDRTADTGGLNGWVSFLKNSGTGGQVIDGIVGSSEYYNKTAP